MTFTIQFLQCTEDHYDSCEFFAMSAVHSVCFSEDDDQEEYLESLGG